MVRIEREYENLRAALAWSLDRDETELALHLCRLPGLWLLGGQFGEMRQLVDRLPSLPFEDDVQRADAINMAGRFAQLLGDNSPEVVSRFEEALALYRAAGHRAGTARALMNLGNVRAREGAYEEARHLFREALPLYQELDDVFGESGALMNLGDTYLGEDDLDRAEEIFQQAQSTARARGNPVAMSFALQYMGAVSHQRGDLDEAEARFREALAVFEAFGARPGIAWTWYYLAMVARDRGNLAEARSHFLDVIEWFRENDYRPGIAVALLGLANLEFRESRPVQAVQLLGTSRALRRGTRMTREAAEEIAEREVEEGGRESLGEAGYERALEEGERFSLERALEIVRGEGALFIDHPAPAT
jgi:tetratricopeptide (TPR) repeat protein